MSRLPVDAEAIRALAAILTETNLTEIEISEGDNRVRVARTPAPVIVGAFGGGPVPAGTEAAGAARVPEAARAAVADFSSHPGAVTSPMVGVAYLAAEPGAPPFVTEGQTVAAGQTLMLIEAMKTFNQIKAPKAGVIARIIVAAGAPVEFGEVLAVID